MFSGEPVGGQVDRCLGSGLDVAAHLYQGIEGLIADGAASHSELGERLEDERAGLTAMLVGMAELVPVVVAGVDGCHERCDDAEVAGSADGLVDQFLEQEYPRMGAATGAAQEGERLDSGRVAVSD